MKLYRKNKDTIFIYQCFYLDCMFPIFVGTKLNSNPSGNCQLLGQTNVGTVSDFLTVCLFSKGPVRDNLNKFMYSTIRTRNTWYIKAGPVQI